MNNPIDEVLLQRFVDGELSDQQRRDALLQMEGEPDHWRELALAFVEMQIWKESVPASLGEPTQHEGPRKVATELPQPATRPANRTAGLLSVVAGVLIALVLGYVTGRGAAGPTEERIATESQPGEQLRDAGVDTTPAVLRLDEAVARCATPFPESYRQKLLEAGYFVDEVHALTSVKLPTGEEVEMPIRNVRILHLGDVAYQ